MRNLLKLFLIITFSVLLCLPVFGGAILGYPKFQTFDTNGDPLVGGKLYTYKAGTSTAKATYSNRTCTTANTNPVILDSRGEAVLYLSGIYKLVLKDSSDVTIWTIDNITGLNEETANIYYPDYYAADQGVAGVSGVTTTIKDCVDAIGTENATIYLQHYKDSTNTNYIVLSNIDFTGKANINVKFEKGALLSSCTSGVTFSAPANIIAQPNQQIFASGVTDINFDRQGIAYPNWWENNATPGTTDMTDAINEMVNSGAGSFMFFDSMYANSGITIADGMHNLTFASSGSGGRVQLRYSPTTGNQITFLGESDNTTIKNLYFYSPNASNGYAVKWDVTKPCRNFAMINCFVENFLNGLHVGYGVYVYLDNLNNWTGQGKAVSGGCGAEFGENSTYSLNVADIRVYLTQYETGVSNSYCTNLMSRMSIIGLCGTGLKTAAGITQGEFYFESNDVAIDQGASSYLFWNGNLSGTSNVVTTNSHRIARTGYQQVRAVVYRGGALTVSGTTQIPFDTEIEDTEGDFTTSSTTGYFTASYSGYYMAIANVAMTAAADGNRFLLQIRKNGTALQSANGQFQASSANEFGGAVQAIIWLNKNDVLDCEIWTSASMALSSARMDVYSLGW